jgi:hypothetical protein
MPEEIVEETAEETIEDQFETGQWLGRRQAFALIANGCSAADAQCLKAIKDNAGYKSLGLTWELFCEQRAGMSRASADRIIDRLEEFGEAYFQLSRIMRISPERYRMVEGAVADQTIEFQGEKIPITRENSVRIAAAVDALQRANEHAWSELLRLGTPLDSKAPVLENPRILSLHSRMDLWLKQAGAIAHSDLEPVERELLLDIIDSAGMGLKELADVLCG